MSTTQPATVNFLSPLGFRLTIDRTPNLNYFIQNVSLPIVSVGQVNVTTPFTKIPVGGDRLTYSDLIITFKVDERMENYLEIFNWISRLGYPETINSYDRSVRTPSTETALSDITLHILSSSKNPLHEIRFLDAHPTTLSELSFSSTLTDVDHLECTATFAFRTFTYKRL
jgi:hypothetical protein